MAVDVPTRTAWSRTEIRRPAKGLELAFCDAVSRYWGARQRRDR